MRRPIRSGFRLRETNDDQGGEGRNGTSNPRKTESEKPRGEESLRRYQGGVGIVYKGEGTGG